MTQYEDGSWVTLWSYPTSGAALFSAAKTILTKILIENSKET